VRHHSSTLPLPAAATGPRSPGRDWATIRTLLPYLLEYKGRVILPSLQNTEGLANLFMAAFLATGKPMPEALKDIDAGFKKLVTLKPNLLTVYTQMPQAFNLLEQGEGYMIAGAISQVALERKAAGAPVDAVAPKEGIFSLPLGAALVKGGPQPELAAAFINTMIDPEVQARLAVATYSLPTNKDAPVPPGGSVRAYHHLLGETGISFFGSKQLAAGHKKGFPQCLDGAPMLLPLENLTLRRLLNQWFERNGIQPKVVAEFEDSALLQVFGADGVGIFAAPSVVEPQVIEQYGVQLIGRTDQVRERFYAISGERRIKNPAVVAICDIARHSLFGRK